MTTPAKAQRPWDNPWLVPLACCLGIFAAVLWAYWPTLSAGFIWNDSDYVTAPALQSWSGLRLIWFKFGATQQYYPLLHSAFWVEHRLWGDSAKAYHLFNFLVHASNACLFGLILQRLRVPWGWLAAFIFALHPVYVESTAWITEEKNTLSTLFYLLSALVYIGPDGALAPRWPRLLGALALYLCAILSKSVAATLPAALLVVIWWKRGRIDWRREALPLLPWFLAAAAIGIITGYVEQKYIGAEGANFDTTRLQQILIAGHVVWFYFGKLIWPAHLVFIYPRWHIDAHRAVLYLYPLSVAAVVVLLWLLRKRSRAPLAATLLFIGGLVPTIGFFHIYAFIFSFVADHWQYVAGFGLIALFAAGLHRLLVRPGHSWTRHLWLAATPILIALAVHSRSETHGYADMTTFYQTIIARNPAAWMAHNNMGEIYLHTGRMEDAKKELSTALKYRPDYPEAESNLGLAYLSTGNPAEALKHLNHAVQLAPEIAIFHNNRGIAEAGLHQFEAARKDYAEALRISPVFPQTFFNLGQMWQNVGRYDLAYIAFSEAYRQDPAGGYTSLVQLGIVAANLGKVAEAEADFQKATQLEPKSPDAYREFGNALRQTGRLDDALRECAYAVNLAPRNAQSRYYVGLVLSDLHRWKEAIEQYDTAIALRDGTYPEAENDLSLAYYHTNEVAKAVTEVKKAVAENPAFAEAENNYAVYLVAQNNLAEAVKHLERACTINPKYYDAWNNRAKVCAALGRKAEAAEAAAKAKSLRPGPAAKPPAAAAKSP